MWINIFNSNYINLWSNCFDILLVLKPIFINMHGSLDDYTITDFVNGRYIDVEDVQCFLETIWSGRDWTIWNLMRRPPTCRFSNTFPLINQLLKLEIATGKVWVRYIKTLTHTCNPYPIPVPVPVPFRGKNMPLPLLIQCQNPKYNSVWYEYTHRVPTYPLFKLLN